MLDTASPGQSQRLDLGKFISVQIMKIISRYLMVLSCFPVYYTSSCYLFFIDYSMKSDKVKNAKFSASNAFFSANGIYS
jgi:hypothetical protein